MYCAVQSPRPGRASKVDSVLSRSAPGLSCRVPDTTACASAPIAFCRCLTMPNCPSASGLAAASVAGLGNSRFSPAKGVSRGSPNCCTRRATRVREAATVICWPSTARTASSKPSSVPGTRKPSPCVKRACSSWLMACGSASRSSQARTWRITAGTTLRSESLMCSFTWQRASSKRASTQPLLCWPPAWRCRVLHRPGKGPVALTDSRPATWRRPKNRSMAATS